MITFEQVSKRYGERLALDSVSWRMDEGECVVFLGPSGAGKTTILRLITHETQPTHGAVTVGTFTGGRLPRAHRALLRRTLGIVYEDFRLLHDRTVFENVALPVRVAGRFADEEVIPRVLFALEEVGLQLKQDSFPIELSAGERQKTAIARAIVNRPAVILADEPTGALEKKSAGEVLQLLKRIHAEGSALLLVTTRQEVADALPARVLQLDDGKLVSLGMGGPPTPGGTPGSREPEASGGSREAIDEWGESEATGTRSSLAAPARRPSPTSTSRAPLHRPLPPRPHRQSRRDRRADYPHAARAGDRLDRALQRARPCLAPRADGRRGLPDRARALA